MSEDYLKYRYLQQFLPHSKRKKLVVLTGARQTGKTTLVKSCYPELRYINLDAPENRERLRTLSTGSWSQTVGNAIIDEALKLLIKNNDLIKIDLSNSMAGTIKLKEEDKKITLGITISREINLLLDKNTNNKSNFIETILKEYFIKLTPDGK